MHVHYSITNVRVKVNLLYFRNMSVNNIIPGSNLLLERNYTLRFLSFLWKNKLQHNVEEHALFPYKLINPSEIQTDLINSKSKPYHSISYNDKMHRKTEDIDTFMKKTESTAFLVMKNNEIITERYYNDYSRDSLFRVYSITKSFTSALIGIALQEGLIKNIDDSIALYLPELIDKTNSKYITIRHLLLMNQGIEFNDAFYPWSENLKTYFHPNTRKFALDYSLDTISSEFIYNDYHPILLGMILERVTGKSVTQYLEEKLWHPLGCEYDAVFSCDSQKHMFEKPESGLNIRAIDLLRFGQLYLNNGLVNGKQIIPQQWVFDSTSPLLETTHDRYKAYSNHPWGRQFFNKPDSYYKYFWWGNKVSETEFDYFALGIMGQVMYISPRNNTIAIRLGKKWNVHDWWPRILKAYIEQLD